LNQNTLHPENTPCVVYLHSQTGSRIEAKACLDVLLPLNISVFTFDFGGCGQSGGEYVTLGYYEKEDVELIINYLRNTLKIDKIGIWGRSMGAVAALLYAEKDPNLACMVVDSPFCNLTKLAEDVAISKTKLPGFVIKGALSFIKSTILKKTKFNMNSLIPEKNVDKCQSPCLFAGSQQDSFVRFWHVQALHR
jgi:pimeloyl-ACP methyl ester carboxylesterase